MGVRHQVSGSGDDPVPWSVYQLDHPGVGEFRVGFVTTTMLDLAVPVSFTEKLSSDAYAIFLQATSKVAVSSYPSDLTVGGFTINLSAGVDATFAYLAIEIP